MYVCILVYFTIDFASHCRTTSHKTIAARDRLTIYFHAVLSKDFKFDPSEDGIFVRAGLCIGKWDEDLVQLFVTRYLCLNN